MLQVICNLLANFPVNFVKKLKGGLARRLGSLAGCWFDEDRQIAVVNFPAYQPKCDDTFLQVGTVLDELVSQLENALNDREDALAVAYIPWFFATECGVLVSQESGLSLIIDADSDDDAETWFQRIEVAYSLDAEVTTSEMLEPGAPIPLVPFQTPAIEDEETLEEIHRLNVERLAAVA